jgi:hypothetical protein
MVTMKRLAWGILGAAALAAGLFAVTPQVNASTTSDKEAAILVFPKISADDVGVCVGGDLDGQPCPGGGCTGGNAYCERHDTLVQIANTDDDLVAAHCFYVNANSHCSNTGAVCTSGSDCIDDGFQGACRAEWSELNFDIRITAEQPLVWSALDGLGGEDTPLPCGGRRTDPCDGNEGTRVPPVPERPFLGELKCIQVDPNDGDRHPGECDGNCDNDLIGQATIEWVGDASPGRAIDPRTYNAVGLLAVENNADGTLIIGGTDPEYEACPLVLILNHMFDGAVDPIDGESEAASELTLVPCGEDLFAQSLTPVTAQFLVYNEFEQRFSTSRQVTCLFNSPLSRIDTSQPENSIFNAGVAGTVAGQTRIRGVNGGLLGMAEVNLQDVVANDGGTTISGGAGYNLNQFGERMEADEADTIRIP